MSVYIQMKQLRANKRHEAYMAKRSVGVEGTPPHLVVIKISDSLLLLTTHRCVAYPHMVYPLYVWYYYHAMRWDGEHCVI